MDDALWEKIDQSRGNTPRERWVREVIEERLEEDEARPSTEQIMVTDGSMSSPGITDERTGRVRVPAVSPAVPTSEGDPECKHWRKRMVNRTRVCIECGKVFP